MSKILLIIVLAFVVSNGAQPLVYSSSFVTSPFTSAALVAPAVSQIAPVAPVSPVAQVAPAISSFAPIPLVSVSDYRYSYGSSLKLQDYLSSPAVPLAYSLPYTLTDLY